MRSTKLYYQSVTDIHNKAFLGFSTWMRIRAQSRLTRASEAHVQGRDDHRLSQSMISCVTFLIICTPHIESSVKQYTRHTMKGLMWEGGELDQGQAHM
jgi:hypothetical protein